MEIVPVDPRDTGWETERPTYRVSFWGRSSAPPRVPPEHVGDYAREYRLQENDLVTDEAAERFSAGHPDLELP